MATNFAQPSVKTAGKQAPYTPETPLEWSTLEENARTCLLGADTGRSPSLTDIAGRCAHFAAVDTAQPRLVIGLAAVLAAYIHDGARIKPDLAHGNSATWLVEWALRHMKRANLDAQIDLHLQHEAEILAQGSEGAALVIDDKAASVIAAANSYVSLVTPGKPLSARHVFAAMLNTRGFDSLLSAELGRTVTPTQLDELRGFFINKLKLKPAGGESVAKWEEVVRPPAREAQTRADEIDALLTALNVTVLDSIRDVLLRATAYRPAGHPLEPAHLLAALLETRLDAQLSDDAPSAMLAKTGLVVLLTRRIAPTADRADPSDPLTFEAALDDMMQRGFTTQQQVFLNPALGTKGLIAAMLTMPYEVRNAAFARHEIVFENIPAHFRDVVRDRLAGKPEQMREWLRALEYESATLPKLNHDQPGQGQAHDKLGITNDALALANVAAGSSTNLPLAFGIFGAWGAGKTFFMRMVQDQIAGFVASDARNDGFEHAIVQIQFNAWHYAETNLWASLVGHIFDELDRWMTRKNGVGAADQILQRLATSRQLTLEAAAELAMRRKEQKKAEGQLAKAEEELARAQVVTARTPELAWRVAFDTVRKGVMSDPDLKRQLGAIGTATGVSNLLSEKDKLAAAIDELNRSASAGNVALGALRATVGNWPAVLLALAALLVAPAVLLGLYSALAGALDWPALAGIGSGIEALAGLVAMLSVFTGYFSSSAKTLADKLTDLKRKADEQIAYATQKELQAVADASGELARNAAQVEEARMLVQATSEQVATALRDYAEESGSALRIRRFVRARAGVDGYGKHLGLVSSIRKDFEQLESLMRNEDEPPHLEEARLHYKARVDALIMESGKALHPDEVEQLENTAKNARDPKVLEIVRFNRIVLYIDDLDRCEPDKVVEILQAVNMLLSFQLFVVMVAVDARWLSRSLEKRYPDFFGPVGPVDEEKYEKALAGVKPGVKTANGRPPNTEAQTWDDRRERATAADYLEKIFQIPYWVPSMSAKAGMSLVGDLVAPDRAAGDTAGSDAITPSAPDSVPTGEPRHEDDQQRSGAQPSRALELTKNEIDTLMALSPFLGGSPRRARRFVNVYRVAKASLTPGEVKKLEAGEHRALATQLAISTGAPNAFGPWMALCKNGREAQLTERVPDELDRRNIEGALKAFKAMPGEGRDVLKKLAAQSLRASRFSFAAPDRRSLDTTR
ncbi:MAG: family P-loop protein [Devosia sp.]|uniref:P-loop NTPase fold protein n=1 Tax=Devosia sp. TaxID=1871048 RepID=UPI00262CAC99|nr:P-loop NTPase fold protein [Devosia sp.]MDB5531349.1 family P-loop protein [Devosia sp.]